LGRHTQTFGHAIAKFGIDLVEMGKLSLFGGHVAYAKMSCEVVHGALPHFLIEDLIEKGTRLFVDGVRVSIGVPSNWSSGFLSVDCILLVLLWASMLCWLIVRGAAIASSNVHDTITLVVCWSQSSPVRAVDGNLVMVGAKAMSVGIGVVDESSLKHLAIGSLNAWHEVSW